MLLLHDFHCQSCERHHELFFAEEVTPQKTYMYLCPVTQWTVAFALTRNPTPVAFVPADSVECKLLTM